jgi:maltodextrin utilization protein YvdJ
MDEAEESCQTHTTSYLSPEFSALVRRHNDQSPPNLPSATKPNSNISISTERSSSVLFESSKSSSTLVGEEDEKHIQSEVAQLVVVETSSNSSRELPTQNESNEEGSMDDIQESLSILWQTSQFLAVWIAALITALISGLQIVQAILAQENQKHKRSTFKSDEKTKEPKIASHELGR